MSGASLVLLALVASAALVAAYLAAGGSGYKPTAVADPCAAREWTSPQGVDEHAQQFTLSALDGAACELGVSRETLTAALASTASREQFAADYGIDSAELEAAVRAGLVRAIDDAERAGALDATAAVPLRALAERLPVETAIGLIEDARSIFEGGKGVVDSLGGVLDEAGNLLP